jgi:hypothetical protein
MRYAGMRRFGFILGVAAGLDFCVAGMSASAAVLTYRFDPGTSFNLDNGGDGFLTGHFTINTASGAFSATDDAAITSGPAVGVYAPSRVSSGELVYINENPNSGPAQVTVNFMPTLDESPASPALEEVDWESAGPGGHSMSVAVAGGATLIQREPPIPEPSTWAMMLLGFAGLGFLGYRQTRKGQAATA